MGTSAYRSRQIRGAIGLATAAGLGWVVSTAAADIPPIAFSVGSNTTLPAIATDLQEAAGLDVVWATQPEIDALVLISGGPEGTLSVSQPVQAGAQPRFVTVADLNGDKRYDLVTSSPNTGRAHVILQNADGTFTLGSVLPVGINPFAPTLVQLVGDELPDLVIPIRGDDEIAILPNLGDGLFGAGTRVSTADSPESVGLADFDGDGILDLAVTCAGASAIQVFFGSQSPDGVQFVEPPLSLPTGSGPNGLLIVDLDGDGTPDLATASLGSSSVSVFYARPERTFEQGPYLFAGTAPQSIVAADLNLSGFHDLAVANPGTQTVTILQNNAGEGFVRSTVQMPFRPSRLSVADLDADGLPDIVAASQTTIQARALLNVSEVAPCPGDVTEDLRVDLSDLNLVLSSFGTDNQRADANGDGQVDLADLNLVLSHFGIVCGER